MSAIRILVVDDFAAWRRSVFSIVQKEPKLQIIGEASDGLEALQRAQELRPDVILLDIGLPKLNGIEVATRLGHTVPSAMILFTSQIHDPDVISAALNNGARGYVLKADAARELLPAIEAVLRGNRFVSSQVKSRAIKSVPWRPELSQGVSGKIKRFRA